MNSKRLPLLAVAAVLASALPAAGDVRLKVCYAGYIVVVRKGDQIIAEAATAGMKNRVKDLMSPTGENEKK
jgi:hypothetical protein